MLIEFRVANYRSIDEEQVLSLEAGPTGGGRDVRIREPKGSKQGLLTVAAVYGANATGKSNLLSALKYMAHAILFSAREWDPEGGITRSPFAWNTSPAEPSLFEVVVVLGGIKYRYGFTVDDDVVVEEWLEAWPKGRKQTWFRREGEEYKFGDHLEGDRKTIQETTRTNALFLSNAAQLRHIQLRALYVWFHQAQFQRVQSPLQLGGRRFYGGPSTFRIHQLLKHRDLTGHGASEFDSFMKLLRASDLGIVEIDLVKEASSEDLANDTPSIPRRARASRIRVRHRRESGDGWLPLELESEGTQTMFQYGPGILAALRYGSLLVVDELESSLHPLLARSIVEQFNSPITNPNNAQLIFSTHDSSLLGTAVGESALRRDQVWLTEKDLDGATVLRPLTDFKPRKGENLERGLLQGRYGAVPVIGNVMGATDTIEAIQDDTKKGS